MSFFFQTRGLYDLIDTHRILFYFIEVYFLSKIQFFLNFRYYLKIITNLTWNRFPIATFYYLFKYFTQEFKFYTVKMCHKTYLR